MSELKIKFKYGDFKIELKGEKETVQSEFRSIRENGLGKIFDSFPTKSSVQIEQKQKTENHPKPQKQNKETPNGENKSKPKRRSTTSYSLVPDLNLRPKDEKSLEEFFNEYSIANNFERNITILYYLRRVLKLEGIGINHIYTCYKKVGAKIPNIYQSLADTKNRKGWIDTTNMDDLKVTIQGENYIEHEASKKDAE